MLTNGKTNNNQPDKKSSRKNGEGKIDKREEELANRKQNEMKRKKSNQFVDSTLPTSEIPENQEIRIPICLKTEKK